MIDSEVRNMNPITYIENPFPEMKGVNLLSKTHRNDKSNLELRLSFKNNCMLTDSPARQNLLFQQPSHPAKDALWLCALAGTQRFFLASVAKYCGVGQDVTHNELCK